MAQSRLAAINNDVVPSDEERVVQTWRGIDQEPFDLVLITKLLDGSRTSLTSPTVKHTKLQATERK